MVVLVLPRPLLYVALALGAWVLYMRAKEVWVARGSGRPFCESRGRPGGRWRQRSAAVPASPDAENEFRSETTTCGIAPRKTRKTLITGSAAAALLFWWCGA